MKQLIFGDIHGRTCWKDILKKEKPDRVIFLGDYVSTHERNISEQQQIDNLNDILKLKENATRGVDPEVILLRGNHDIQHLTHDTSTCAYFPQVGDWMCKNKDRFMKATQWVFEDDDIVFSHAGISQVWFERCQFESIAEINECEQFMLFEFTPNKFSDYSGISSTQPLTWIRPYTLLEYGIPNKTFVVGHTSLKPGIVELGSYIRNYGKDQISEYFESIKDKNIKVWCCDALPYQYLVIEDGKFIVKKNYTEDPTTW